MPVYDALDRLTGLTHQVAGGGSLASYAYAYDVAGRLTRESNAEGVTSYTYDRTGQLATVVVSSGTTTFTYDLAGNRAGTGHTTTNANRATAVPGYTLAYDDEGNLTSKTATATGFVTTYAYDHRNRLVGITTRNGGGTVRQQATYVYDALDRRIRVAQVNYVGTGEGTGTTWTVYDGANPYADVDGITGALKTRYLHGDAVDWLLARTDAAGNLTSWYLTDRQGTVRDVAGTSGAKTYHAAYDAFGERLTTSGTGGDRFGYTGREHDALFNQRYHRARYFDEAIDRWTQEDPIGFTSGDPNFYRYVGNGPTNYADPSGLEAGYLEGVGDVFRGYGDAAQGTAQGLWFMVRHPIQTAQGVGTAVCHPIRTGRAVWEDVSQKSGTLRGQGELFGDVLIGVVSGGTIKTVSKSATVAKVTSRLKRAPKPDHPRGSAARNAVAPTNADLQAQRARIASQIHQYELGWDPAKKKFAPHEAELASQLEQRLGIQLTRDPSGDLDWIQRNNGRTFDACSPGRGPYFNLRQWSEALGEHFGKQGLQRIPVDLRGLTPAQVSQIKGHINALSETERAKIIFVE